MRAEQRAFDELRKLRLQRHYTCHAEGSVLAVFGNTQVLCNASFDAGVPRFLKGSGKGWVTAEYGMLPRSTSTRMRREVNNGRAGGRTLEIQRLIGRSLRSIIALEKLGENTLILDCDVIQADGGTRTAAITGACVAMIDALRTYQRAGKLLEDPLLGRIAAVSVGICDGKALLDLDYAEDGNAATDMNVVMNDHGKFIEIQGTAEKQAFSAEELQEMLTLAKKGITSLLQLQEEVLREP